LKHQLLKLLLLLLLKLPLQTHLLLNNAPSPEREKGKKVLLNTNFYKTPRVIKVFQ